MDTDTLHLAYPDFYEAVYKGKPFTAAQWQHVHNCESCLLGLANLIVVSMTIAELEDKERPA